MSVLTSQTVLSLLRTRLSDDAAAREAFSLKIHDRKTNEAIVTLNNSSLKIVLINSVRAQNVTLDLNDRKYNTIGKLVKHLNALDCYEAVLSEFSDLDFVSAELQFRDDSNDILDDGVKFYCRIFSDFELMSIIGQAAKTHNINYSYETIPEDESALILDLAQAIALRLLATNSVKRSGLDTTTDMLLQQADAFQTQYDTTWRRQQRAIPVPSINDDQIGEGDIVSGKIHRMSLRYGMKVPRDAAIPTERPILFDFNNQDIGDDYILIKWKKVFQEHVVYLELWRDIQPNVYRVHDDISKFRTSVMIFKVARDYAFSTPLPFDTQLDRSAAMYADGITNNDDESIPPIEPEFTYYYRLFLIDNVGNVIDSNVVSCKTKRIRAKFSINPSIIPISLLYGPMSGGTFLTIRGTNFHQGMSVRIGDKQCTNVIYIDSTHITVVTPPVFNKFYKNIPLDVVLISNTGLIDILPQKWRYVDG